MARGRDAHRAAAEALSALGKPLSRRARSKCELCGEAGSLTPTALFAGEPTVDEALLLCARCGTLLGSGRHDGLETLRFLETAVWSELRPAQLVAVHVSEKLAQADDASWVRDMLEGLWLDEGVRADVDRLG